MSKCNDCFNGCVETTSDRCVKYTGSSVPSLGIEEGETYSLFEIEKIITDSLPGILNGVDILPAVNPNVICNIVMQYLPPGDTFNLADFLSALIQISCILNDSVIGINGYITYLNTPYTVDCGYVDGETGIRNIFQATISAVCSLLGSIDTLFAEFNNYVSKAEINDYIAAYLANNSLANKAYSKMVPYTVVEYYGSLSGYPTVSDSFSLTGAGQGYWEKVYLCNGQNGTPDKRGFSPVGDTGMGSTSLNSIVTGLSYTSWLPYGDKEIVLSIPQIPSHIHFNTAVVSPNPHIHTFDLKENGGDEGDVFGYPAVTDNPAIPKGTATTNSASLSVSVTNVPTGGGLAHSNIPPVLACYYIMYIP